jgi:(4S)-4-hydroxy-5-phosphonooxypentane-2,3-dione isomerase
VRPYVIIVEFTIKTGEMPHFMPLMLENAERSLADEPGCRRFDVLTGEDGRVILYEIYDDEAAFQAHCRSPHFHRFDQASKPFITAKRVERCTLFNYAPANAG